MHTNRPATVLARFLQFLTGGGVATLLHWLVMFGLIRQGHDPRLATAAGATLGMLANYLLQYHLIYRSDLPHRIAFSRYVAASALGWVINLSLFTLLLPLTQSAWLSQAGATAAVTVVSFFCSERMVFHEPTTLTRR